MDRGILFGDGVYEVTRVISGKLFKEQEHLDRLRAGLKGLKIDIAEEVILSIPDISRELIKKNGHAEGEASVYLQITRGTAWPRTHSFPDPEVEPTLRSEEHTSELQSRGHLVCRLLLEKKKHT